MSERRIVHIDARTGEIRESRTMTTSTGWAERVANLRVAALEQAGEPEVEMARVLCDGGCGRAVELEFPALKLPPGWTSDKRGELCPQCQ